MKDDPNWLQRQIPPAQYPPLPPDIEPQAPDEPALLYGGRVLAYLIAYDGWTASLTDEDLEQADHAAITATAGHDPNPIMLVAVTRAKHTIAATLRARHKANGHTEAHVPMAPPSLPPTGPMARLEYAPTSRPPAGQTVDIRF